jgi:hypothetical protein
MASHAPKTNVQFVVSRDPGKTYRLGKLNIFITFLQEQPYRSSHTAIQPCSRSSHTAGAAVQPEQPCSQSSHVAGAAMQPEQPCSQSSYTAGAATQPEQLHSRSSHVA